MAKRKRKSAEVERSVKQLLDEGLDVPTSLKERFSTMTAFERKLVIKSLREIRDKGISRTLDSLWKRDFRWKPVGIKQFIEDGYYVGDQVADLFPRLKKDLEVVFAPGADIQEVILGGSIGWGKTTFSSIGLTYLAYYLSCLKNPHDYYHLMPGSNIVLGIYSVTKTQSYDTSFAKIRTFIDESTYFRENFPRVRHIKSKIVFQRGKVQIVAGCVAAGTMIDTPTGAVSVEDLPRVSDRVMTLDAGLRYAPFGGVVDSGMQTCLDLCCTEGYTLRCSANHKVMVKRGSTYEYCKAKDLCEGDTLLGLRKEKADQRLLSPQGRDARREEVQRVCEETASCSLSLNEDLQGQESTATGSAEKVLSLSEYTSARELSEEACETQKRVQDLLIQRVQELRSASNTCVLSQEQFNSEQEGEEEVGAKNGVRNCETSKTLAEVLRRTPLRDTGENVVACCAFTYQRETETLAFAELGQTSGIREEASKEVPGVLSTSGEESKTQVSRKEEKLEGYAYFTGRKVSDGVLLEQVRLLWSRDYAGQHDTGSRTSGLQGRRNDPGKYGSVVQNLQLLEERESDGDVGAQASTRDLRCGDLYDCGIQEVTLEKIVNVGVQQTYDIVEVGSPNHSVVTNGLVSSNSSELHTIGLDMFGFLLDEANFLHGNSKAEDGDSVAVKLYNSAKMRLKSRFMQSGGKLPGMVFLVSSKKTHRSFLERHIDEVRDEINDGTVYLMEYKQWEVRDQRKYQKPKFKVELGDQTYPSRVLGDGDAPRPGADIIEVPGEFRAEFSVDVDQALRDIAGVATYGISPLIHNREMLDRCVTDELAHPFLREEVVIDEKADITLDQYFIPESLFVVRRSKYFVKNQPGSPRFVHVDIGLTGDCAGIACSHVAFFKKVRRERGDGTFFYDRAPVIQVDFMLRIRPPRGNSEIDLSKIRAFLISLRDQGLPIIKLTFDGFQSRDSMQIMRKIGFESNVYSVDRTDEPYLYLRQAIVEQRIQYYKYPTFLREMKELERDIDSRKVDHPKVSSSTGMPGSKDVADAVCGSVAQCLIDPRVSVISERDLESSAEAANAGSGTVAAPSVSTKNGNLDWEQIERETRR